jgi:hypothetical protein
MEVVGGGDESAPSAGLAREKKRPPSPSTSPSDGEGSPTSDEDDNPWAVTDDEEEDEYYTYHLACLLRMLMLGGCLVSIAMCIVMQLGP